MEKVINLKGEEINFNAYSTKHRERFNEDFAPFVGGEW